MSRNRWAAALLNTSATGLTRGDLRASRGSSKAIPLRANYPGKQHRNLENTFSDEAVLWG